MKILIIEDEKKIADAIKKGLQIERYVVDIAYRGDDGYDLASTVDYDLIILDIMLPGMDGIELCKKLRSEGNTTKILMLTAKSQVVDRVKGLDMGADDYLTKPFAFDELLARIRALLRRPKKTISETFCVDDLTLNTKTHEVFRDAKKLELTKREFMLLLYFIKNKGIIVTKDQITEHVWDYDSDILPNTVEVHVKKLREKIDKPFPDKKPLLHTVFGFGYKLGEGHV